MTIIEYFKLQAKNLYKDFKTQKPYFDSSLQDIIYGYNPRFFDVDALLTDFDIDEAGFSLMNAQHIIARLAGFEKWTAMQGASPAALELSKLLFDNMHKIRNEEWQYYLLDVESENHVILDDEDKLDIFRKVFASADDHRSDGYDYRLCRIAISLDDLKYESRGIGNCTSQISDLPLIGVDREEFISVANDKFESLVQFMRPEFPELLRELWSPEKFIDGYLLSQDMLPIDRDYALSLIDAFLIHHFADLDTETNNTGYA